MKNRFSTALLASLISVFGVHAQTADVEYSEKADPDAQDMDALRKWLSEKNFISTKGIKGDFVLSGEVRTEFQAISERVNGVQNRNNPTLLPNTPKAKPMYGMDVEVNLMLDYRDDRTWGAVKLEFDNNMGQRGGDVSKIALEKAFAGGRAIDADLCTLDVELGRRHFYNVFESKLQFGSQFDGALVKLNKVYDAIGNFYFNGATFLINDINNHYGWIFETGALQIADTGLNAKYSLINWYRPGGETDPGQTAMQTALANQRYRYLVSQVALSYQMNPEWLWGKSLKCYAGGLINHFATHSKRVKDADTNLMTEIIPTDGRKHNLGAYIGASLGAAKKSGDWAIDLNYQILQTQAVPDFDMLGIGRGNSAGVGTYTNNIDGSGGRVTRANTVGSGNFQGFEIEGLYALTDHFVIQQTFKYSTRLSRAIGPGTVFKQYEVEVVYAF